MAGINAETDGSISLPLLGDGEPLPYEVLNEDSDAKYILICDHAANLVPKKLANLGLSDEILEKHFAVDIGIRELTMRVAEILGAPAILGTYSRLVVDVNRHLDHPTSFVTNVEGSSVPGNVVMSEGERELRINEIYMPYHARLDQMIGNYLDRDIVPALISLHSFTPEFYEQKRPWELGVLWVQDPRIPVSIMDYFQGQDICVGDNEPYDARILRGTTINKHADARLLPNALFEIRNDVLQTEEGMSRWTDMISECLKEVMADETIYSYYDGPQFAHDPEQELVYFENLTKKEKGE